MEKVGEWMYLIGSVMDGGLDQVSVSQKQRLQWAGKVGSNSSETPLRLLDWHAHLSYVLQRGIQCLRRVMRLKYSYKRYDIRLLTTHLGGLYTLGTVTL
jgi:hypothetical protein